MLRVSVGRVSVTCGVCGMAGGYMAKSSFYILQNVQ